MQGFSLQSTGCGGRPGGLEHHLKNQGASLANHEIPAIDNIGRFGHVANLSHGSENENPGALAGASGANVDQKKSESEYYRTNLSPSMALCVAIVRCDPHDAALIMEKALSDMAAGMPIAPLLSTMDEAAFWADLATPGERKAYALASFNRMSVTDQGAFLAYVHRGAE
jgi:hypothetical protein